MEKDFSKLTPGERQLFYRNNASEIIDYCSQNGFLKAQEYYHMGIDTLTKILIKGGYDGKKQARDLGSNKQNEMTSLKIQINAAAISDLRKEIRELKEMYSRFQEEVSNQLVQKFFTPMMQHMQLELPAGESENDIYSQVEMIAAMKGSLKVNNKESIQKQRMERILCTQCPDSKTNCPGIDACYDEIKMIGVNDDTISQETEYAEIIGS